MSSIKQEIIHGVMWSAVEKYSGLIVSILVSAILARLLSPAEYGVIAIASIFIWFMSMFVSMGIGPAIIQRKDLSKQDLNNIFTFTICMGIGLAIICFCSSWLIADFYNNQQLVPVCQLFSLSLFLSALNLVPSSLMAKHKRFKESAKRTLILQILTGILSIIAAYNGFGVYSLLISPILTSIGTFFYNRHFYPTHISWHLSIEPIKRIFSFSIYQFLFEFANYFSRNLDKLIIGRYMSITDLGYYEKSYRLMQLPLQNITSVINPVLQPVLSILQDNPQEIGHKYDKIIRFISTISFPLSIILSMCAYEIIHLFYGGNWDAAVPVFRILALSVCFQMILSTSGSIFMACNNTKSQFWVGIRNTVTTVAGFMIAAIYFKTIEAMAWAWVITLIINFICTYYIMYKWVLKISMLSMFKEMFLPFLNAILLLVTLLSIQYCICINNIIIMLAIKVCISLIVTFAFIQISGQYNIYSLIKSTFTRT